MATRFTSRTEVCIRIRVLATLTLFALTFNFGLAQSALSGGAAGVPAFEVADVYLSPHSDFFPPFLYDGFQGDRYELHQATMLDLISTAYGLESDRVQGGPSWLEWDRFDVFAKAPPGTPPATLRRMLESLLRERFGLVVHTTTAPISLYELTVGKGKPKMKTSERMGTGICQFVSGKEKLLPDLVPQIHVSCQDVTTERFAQDLVRVARGYFDRPVLDSTGLKGAYDFDLSWTAPNLLAKAGADGLSIFDAVDRELGLNLALQMVPRPLLIVDSVRKSPTPNPPGVKSLSPPPPPEFEVATVKPSKPGPGGFVAYLNGDGLNIFNAPLNILIKLAWNVPLDDKGAVVGAPSWLDTDRFDISAKFPASDAAGGPKTLLVGKSQLVGRDELQTMERTLLEQRFKLQVHREDRPMTAYTLVAVSPKLARADPKNRTHCAEVQAPIEKGLADASLDRVVSCQNVTMAQFGEELRRLAPDSMYYPVLDATRLKGTWDLMLRFTSAERMMALQRAASPSDGVATEPSGALSLFDALKQQLGLKLMKETRPEPVFVIDHVEQQPTPN